MTSFLADLVSARNEADMRVLLKQMADHAGFETYVLAYGHAPEENQPLTVWHNFPQGWDGVGEPGMADRDPVTKLIRAAIPRPIIWGKALYEQADAVDLWELFSTQGIRSGIDSPVRNPDGTRLVLTLAGDKDDLPRGEELIRQLNTTMTAASCFSAVVPGIVTAEQFVADLSVAHFDLLRFLFEGQSLEALARRYHQTEAFIGRQLASLAQRAGFQHPLSTALFAIRGAA